MLINFLWSIISSGDIFPSLKSIARFSSCSFEFKQSQAREKEENIVAMLKGHKHTVNSGNRLTTIFISIPLAHLQKITKSGLDLCTLATLSLSSAVAGETARIMMFVSMVNSRFYVHVFLFSSLVKLPLQKLLLFSLLAVGNNKEAA